MILGYQRLSELGLAGLETAEFPLAIAHRGASAYAADNSERALRLAAELEAEYSEIDIQLSADGVCVLSHDDDIITEAGDILRIAETDWSTLSSTVTAGGSKLLSLERAIALAQELDRGLYVEIKAPAAGQRVWHHLVEAGFKRAIIGSFHVSVIRELRDAGCRVPLAIMVPQGMDAIMMADTCGADVIHLCWRELNSQPHLAITDALISGARDRGMAIVTWHEERRAVLDGLARFPILGVCSDRPETVKPYNRDNKRPISIVCHRGANWLAPENTLEAARICFGQRFDYVELDVRTSADGHLVVMHDETVDRTTDGCGQVADMTLSELQRLDAGSWFRSHFTGEPVPTLREMMSLADECGGRLYIEPKKVDPAALLAAVQEAGMMDRCFFGSVDPQTMRDLRRLSPDAMLMARRCDFGSLEAAIADSRSQIVEFDTAVDDIDELEDCRRLGVRSMVHDRARDLASMDKLVDIGPDLVNLDRPDLFKRAMRAKIRATNRDPDP